MYKLSRTILVNEPGKPCLSRHDVWVGLEMKANNALPYVPIMQKCEVVQRGTGWLTRDIVVNNVPLREKVTFEPEQRVIFERIAGSEPGRIENTIGEDERGDLTLTFSFALSKEGLADGSESETKHFAPMEGAYLGAVSSTLAAVRRTVEDRGREAIPFGSTTDTSGDPHWIFEFFRTADSLDMERFLALHTEDVSVTVANYPTGRGKQALAGAIGAVWKRIKAMSHSISGAWSLHDGAVGIAETLCMYTRLDGTTYTIRPCTVLRRRGNLIYDLRINADMSQL
jgi:acetylaranotin biosynthesis cluster protein L/SnoaL-like protein